MKYSCLAYIFKVKYFILLNKEDCIKKIYGFKGYYSAIVILHLRQFHIKFPFHLCICSLSTKVEQENRIKTVSSSVHNPSEFNFMNHFSVF